MIWLDESVPNHPKIVTAGQLIGGPDGRYVALGMYVEAVCYARHLVTDGIIPGPLVNRYRRRREGQCAPATALVRVKLFERLPGGHYKVHDYHDYNPTAAQVKEDKRLARERKAAWRAKQKGGSPGSVPPLSHRDNGAAAASPDVHDPLSIIHDPVRENSAPRGSRTRDPGRAGNFHVIAAVVRDLLQERSGEYSSEVDPNLIEDAKQRCAELRIDYGDHPDVDLGVIYAAVASEWFKFKHPELVGKGSSA
jgi:hypothetical protein